MKRLLLALLLLPGLHSLPAQGFSEYQIPSVVAFRAPSFETGSTATIRTNAIQLDSVWESGLKFSLQDSILYRREYYTYPDTLKIKNTYDLSPGDGFELLERTTSRVKSANNLHTYDFIERLENSIFDTTELTLKFYSPLTDEVDSTKTYTKPANSNDLKLSRTQELIYDDNLDPIEFTTRIYNTTTGQLQNSYRTNIVFQSDDILDEVYYYTQAGGSSVWELTGKAEYYYAGNLLDSVSYFDNTPTGLQLVQWINQDYSPGGALINYEVFYLDAGIFHLIFQTEILLDDQERPIQRKSTNFFNGIPVSGELKTTTFYVDAYPKLEKSYILNTGTGQYDFTNTREYFYSGAVGAFEHRYTAPLIVSPNPVTHTLQLNAPAGAWVEIAAPDGSILLRRQIEHEGVNTLSVADLPAGVCFISITTRQERRAGIFIKL